MILSLKLGFTKGSTTWRTTYGPLTKSAIMATNLTSITFFSLINRKRLKRQLSVSHQNAAQVPGNVHQSVKGLEFDFIDFDDFETPESHVLEHENSAYVRSWKETKKLYRQNPHLNKTEFFPPEEVKVPYDFINRFTHRDKGNFNF